METIFDHIYSGDKKMTPPEIKTWLGSIQDARETGLVGMYTPPNEKMAVLLHRGNWLYAYPEMPNGFNSASLMDHLSQNRERFARFVPLSAYGLIHSNLIMQVDIFQKEQWSGFIGNSSLLSKPAGSVDPYLLRLNWRGVSGSILFNGVSNEPHSLIVSENSLLEQSGVSEEILRFKDDPSCIATVYSFDPSLDAWLELKLRSSFKLLCDQLLDRFEQLTGRIITEAFARLMEAYARQNNLGILMVKRRLVNQEFYMSTGDASEAYKRILLETLEHFSAVIGPRLLASNLREVYMALPEENRYIIKTFNIIPEGYAL